MEESHLIPESWSYLCICVRSGQPPPFEESVYQGEFAYRKVPGASSSATKEPFAADLVKGFIVPSLIPHARSPWITSPHSPQSPSPGKLVVCPWDDRAPQPTIETQREARGFVFVYFLWHILNVCVQWPSRRLFKIN